MREGVEGGGKEGRESGKEGKEDQREGEGEEEKVKFARITIN